MARVMIFFENAEYTNDPLFDQYSEKLDGEIRIMDRVPILGELVYLENANDPQGQEVYFRVLQVAHNGFKDKSKATEADALILLSRLRNFPRWS